jgi:transposase
MRDAYNHRLRLVQSARQRGIKPTARLFQTTIPTVRKWLRRYQQQGPRGLIELSRAPHRQPGKTRPEVEQPGVALRQQRFTFGARCLIREFDLPLSHRALERIWRQHGLLKNGSANISANKTSPTSKPPGASFSKSPPTPKDLDDIPRYWPQAQAFDLPAVEYTAREVRSGLLFWALAQRRSAAASSVFAARIQQHLERCGISLRDLVWQTDNGSEFIGGHDRRGHPTGAFPPL